MNADHDPAEVEVESEVSSCKKTVEMTLFGSLALATFFVWLIMAKNRLAEPLLFCTILTGSMLAIALELMSFVGAVTLTNIRIAFIGAGLFCAAVTFYFRRQVAFSEEIPTADHLPRGHCAQHCACQLDYDARPIAQGRNMPRHFADTIARTEKRVRAGERYCLMYGAVLAAALAFHAKGTPRCTCPVLSRCTAGASCWVP